MADPEIIDLTNEEDNTITISDNDSQANKITPKTAPTNSSATHLPLTRRPDTDPQHKSIHRSNNKKSAGHPETIGTENSKGKFTDRRSGESRSTRNGRRTSTSPQLRDDQELSENDAPNRDSRGMDNSENKKNQKSGSSKKKKSKSRAKSTLGDDIFFVDVDPIVLSSDLLNNDDYGKATRSTGQDLLLPLHVTIQTVDEAEDLVPPLLTNLPSPHESDDDDFIRYLDREEIQKGMRRYFDPESDEDLTTIVCKHCGAEGDHKTSACPVIICLTCGVHNEHTTRSCPISKTCFTCNMKGHVSKDCPNRNSRGRRSDTDRLSMYCERCGMDTHAARSCPTLWRQYEYVSDRKRNRTLSERRDKARRALGQGGEGYIGEDEWCYGCGGVGHLGDDCTTARRPYDFPREPSAFSIYNTLSGPFADDTTVTRSGGRSTRLREWEHGGTFDDGYGFSGPSDVGKRGRDKERERMRKRERDIRDAYEEDDDWFNRDRRRGNNDYGARSSTKSRKDDDRRDRRSKPPPPPSKDQKKTGPISFSLKGKDDTGRTEKRSLIDRIALDNDQTYSRNMDDTNDYRRDRDERDRDRDRDRDRGPANSRNGRRYKDNNSRSTLFDDNSRQRYFGGYDR